ncbi:MAG: formylglycine-generating enzyme family protein [Desulfobacterales bacterium]|nr:formylglycine-generating enzyme family protein [Desulfobacterales bacterium]
MSKNFFSKTQVWCTGRVDLNREFPILENVDSEDFKIKLGAFLSPDNPDLLFIVPEANLTDALQISLYKDEVISILSLKQFQQSSPDELFRRKTILKVQRNELALLIKAVFQKRRQGFLLKLQGILFKPSALKDFYELLKSEITFKHTAIVIFMLAFIPGICWYLFQPGPLIEWEEPVTKMVFTKIPGGCYEMGCGSWTDDCFPYELPVHKVCVDEFWIGKKEVTVGQWKKIMGNNEEWKELMKNTYSSVFSRSVNYPAVMVNWHDVKNFARELSKKTGREFRLPTEAEWEYACRSRGGPEKYAGGTSLDKLAWYSANTGKSVRPVGEKKANSLGLYDMSGNVKEWCEDMYHSRAYHKHQRNNPVMEDGTGRVIRGGSWNCESRFVRCGFRFGVALKAGGVI